MAPSFSGVWKLQTKYQYSSAFPIDLNLGDLGLYAGGVKTEGGTSYLAEVDKLTLAGNSNATDFGDLSTNRGAFGTASSDTRMLTGGGFYNDTDGNDVQVNTIEYFTYASASNSTDFGDLTATKYLLNGLSNNIRGIFHGGSSSGSTINVIEYVTIASTGNATDFGDLTNTRSNHGYGICASTTRGILTDFNTNVIEYLTIPSTGNTRDFGDMTVTRKQGHAQMASATRGVFGGGRDNSNNASNIIDYITIASAGNATDFGDLAAAKYTTMGMSSLTKGFIAGGYASSYENVVEQITIATTGNATDFGDLTRGKGLGNGASNGQAAFQSLSALPSAGNTGLMTGALDSFIESIDIATLGNSVAFGDISYTYINGSFGGASSATRMCVAGGYFDGGRQSNIDLTTFATRGLGVDFGDLTVARQTVGNSNSTRGLFASGQTASGYTDTIDYITIASAGNATDFGNLVEALMIPGVSGSPTRMLFSGGRKSSGSGTSGYSNQIGYVTISSTGNTTDFGDLLETNGFGIATSSSTRSVHCGGYTGAAGLNRMQYMTIASTGDSTDFGDLLSQWSQGTCFSNGTRGVVGQGYNWETSANQNVIQYFTIASTGDSIDFGDALNASNPAGQSNGHGGLS